MNTKKGGVKVAETIRAKYGHDYWVKLGSKGGKAKNPNKGFGSDRQRASESGRKGGLISRRTKKS